MNESVVSKQSGLKIKNELRQINHIVVVSTCTALTFKTLRLRLAYKASPHHAFSYFLYIKHFAAFEYARTCST